MALGIESILIGTDLTTGSDSVVRSAAAIAALTDAELHVLHAFDLQPYPEAATVPGTFQDRIDTTRRAVREQIRRAVPSSVRVASVEVVIYVPYRALLERAIETSSDLLVLGRTRKRPLTDRLLGSTTDQVVRNATVPCLILPDGIDLPLRRVIAPLDPAQPIRPALDLALQWASSLGVGENAPQPTEVHVLSVLTPNTTDAVRRRIASTLERELAQAFEALPGQPERPRKLEAKHVLIDAPTPAEGILDYANREAASMIVLGTRGRGAIQRVILGSVAAEVARGATCPVMLVPPGMWHSAR